MDSISGTIDYGCMDVFLTTTRDVVFVFTTLEVSIKAPETITDGRIDADHRKATVEATDEISYDWPNGSFWGSHR